MPVAPYSAFLQFQLLAAPALARQKSDRFQLNHDIIVEPGQTSGDLECVNCSAFVRGEVHGDVSVIHGNLVIEHGGKVTGDVCTVLGDLRLHSGAQVQGDAAAVGGTVRRAPEATINGDVTSLGGTGWVLLIMLLPLAVLGGLIVLIVWLIARIRQRPASIAA